MIKQDFINRIDELIERGNTLNDKTFAEYDSGTTITTLHINLLPELYAWESSCLNLISIIVGQRSHYYERFPRLKTPDFNRDVNRPAPDLELKIGIKRGIGILMSIKDELTSELIFSQEILITKDLLSSISDEATALLKANYLPASAIYCRVYIEHMIKKLGEKNNIEFDKDSRLNRICDELKNKEIITLSDWRQILAWIDLGNSAAHGNFDVIDAIKVSSMISGLRQFEERYLK